MAKPEETSASQSGSRGQPFGGREFQQASGNAQQAARNAQAGVMEFISGEMIRPYAELTEQIESSARHWAEGVRTAVEESVNIANKLHETWLSEAKRSSDACLQLFGVGLSMQRSLMRETEQRMRQQSSRAEAAE